MARAISVKIPTAKVIEMIEGKIAEINEDIASYPERKAKYIADRESYTKAVVERVGKALVERGNELLSNEDSDNSVRVSSNYQNRTELTIGSDILAGLEKPVEPTNPEPKNYYGRSYSTKREELEKTLRLLKMSEQETITSSAYNSVLELL
jgi:hypothetical protein